MNPADFSDQKSGRLIKTLQGYWAYIPNPLPPPLDISWDLTNQISKADRMLSELAGITRTLPNPHLLLGPFIKREAVLSSHIEGTQASLSDLFFFEASGSVTTNAADVREVENYVTALEYGLKRLEKFPLSLRLFREIHEKLLKGVRGQHLTPGEFRHSQNWIGKPGCTLMEARFVPPPPDEMKEALGELEKYLHAPPTLPPLVRMALVHHQFETIHPFLDGNGRIGRLLITFMLCAGGILPAPILSPSAFFDRHKQEYYEHLLNVRTKGTWTEWIGFFLKGIEEQSEDAIKRSDKLLRLWKKYRDKLLSARSSTLQLKLIDALFASPAMTVIHAKKILKVTTRSAQLNIEKLEKEGILKGEEGKQRKRIYVAPEIMRIIEEPESK